MFYVISRFDKLYQYFIHGAEIPSSYTMQGQTVCLVLAAESSAVTLAMGIFLYVLYNPPSILAVEQAFSFASLSDCFNGRSHSL